MTDMTDVPDPKNTDSYRMLRAVVIGLGVLIVIAVVLLVVGLATRLGGHGKSGGTSADAAGYTLPTDAKIRSMQVANNRLIMEVEEDGVDRVLIFNTDDGHLVGQIVPQER